MIDVSAVVTASVMKAKFLSVYCPYCKKSTLLQPPSVRTKKKLLKGLSAVKQIVM
jgi:hypothetical protein